MSVRKGFVTNMERCIGCHACEIACKAYHGLEPDMKRRRVQKITETIVGEPVRAYLSASCNHCENPACLAICPVKAYSKREDGIVVHDAEVCIGCKKCQEACPYGAPTFNNVTGKMDKCDSCKDRLDKGLNPVCVSSCPMMALESVDMNTIDETKYVKDVEGFPKQDVTGANLRMKLPTAVQQSRR